MCLILVAWRMHAAFPLIAAANRDELHARAASAAAFWPDRPGILAGRDLQANGTWLGVSRSGKFASVTNYRGGHDANAVESRGALVARFLLENLSPEKYLKNLNPDAYSGFNLLVADQDELWWLSNRGGETRRLGPGFYALGNFLLDTPEVMDIKRRFEGAPAAVEPLFSVLAGAKIVAPDYGTRCATVLLAQRDGRMQLAERPFEPAGGEGSTVRYEFGRAA